MVARRRVLKTQQSLHEAAAAGDVPKLLNLLRTSFDEDACKESTGSSATPSKAVPNEYVYATVQKDRPVSINVCDTVSIGSSTGKKTVLSKQRSDGAAGGVKYKRRGGGSLLLRRKATVKARARVQRNKSKYNLEGDGASTVLLREVTPSEDMALFDAVREGMPLAVQTLLMTGEGLSKIDNPDHEGLTPLMRAAINDQLDCMRLLLDFGANPDVQTTLGCTALHFAASQGGIDCVELLLEAKASVDPATKFGATPLMLAAKEGQADCLRLLLERGGNVNCLYTNQNARSNALLFAAEVGHYDCVKILLEHNIDVNQPNSLGVSPLMRSVQHHNNECATLLIDNGARLSANDARGRTALHYAVEYDNVTAVKMLLRSGADINIETQGGSTALTYARRTRNNKCIEILERHAKKQELEAINAKNTDEDKSNRLLGWFRKCARSINCLESCR